MKTLSTLGLVLGLIVSAGTITYSVWKVIRYVFSKRKLRFEVIMLSSRRIVIRAIGESPITNVMVSFAEGGEPDCFNHISPKLPHTFKEVSLAGITLKINPICGRQKECGFVIHWRSFPFAHHSETHWLLLSL